jgi:hypothetical protein
MIMKEKRIDASTLILAFKTFVKQPSEENYQELKEARHQLLREKRKAKRHWQFAAAQKCKKSDFAINLKEAWSMIFKLMEGFQKHHKVNICLKTLNIKMV